MPTYKWSGLDNKGKKIYGIDQANNRKQLKINLVKKNIFPLTIRLNLKSIISPYYKIKTKHITHLIGQLSILINANISINNAFTIIAQDELNPKLKKLIFNCKNSIIEGKSLYVG